MFLIGYLRNIQVKMDGVDITQNIKAECYGDVNGSYIPPTKGLW